MTISALPPAPQPTDSTADFNTKAFAFVAALQTFVTQANALASEANTDADNAGLSAAAANVSAGLAEVAAAMAIAATNAQKWVSGTTYAEGNVVWSPADSLSYRRKTNGAGTTDPTSDTTNWALVSSNVSTTAVQTLLNKTLNSPTINNPLLHGVKEVRVDLGSGSVIDMSQGNWFIKTITGNTTFTVTNVPASGTVGAFVLDLTNGGSATITLWSGIKRSGGTAPVLTASGRDVLVYYTLDGGTTWSQFTAKDFK